MAFNPNPSPLDSLSDEQKQQLLSWLDLHPVSEIVAKVAAPAPEGFGLKTYRCSLRRFYARHQLASQPEENQLAAEITKAAETKDLDNATTESLKRMAFELATSPKINAKKFKVLSRWVLRIRDQEREAEHLSLARERLTLEREKFQYSAARAALNHYVELGDILRNSKTDNEDKIFAARDLLFGIRRNNGAAEPFEANGQQVEPSQASSCETNR